ncbi:aldehyde dehydrogenase family protein, partial [Pseudomonas sp. CM25]|uniref:aldehyde dehydrogenase family protein n=1 Tax=Pseudomonas sp. CM25 TaxID=2738448 RepID=UPI0015530EB3
MADLLSKEQYAAIAAELQLRTQAFIDGEFRDAISGRTFVTTNPATGKQLAEVAACDVQDVDVAVAAAKRVFEEGTWSKMQPNDRKHVLQKFAQLLEDNAHELAVLEALDSGKPVSECQNVDVPETIHTIRWHAELIDKIYDATAPTGNAAVTMVVREAIGVVGLVLPWNFPLLMLAWKIAPSLAAGCSIVVKPAKETTLSALRVAELAHEAGIPAGVFNLVPGGGREVGEAIGRHMHIPMVSFTGSTDTGRLFLKYAAESNLKRIVLELGGKNPAVVMNDCEDLNEVADFVTAGAFWNMGENCSASSRLIVHKDVKDELLSLIGKHLKDWKLGDPLDPDNRLGAMVSKSHFEKVKSYLEYAAEHKLDVVQGGEAEQGVFIQPTIVDNVGRDNKLFIEEIFGPVLSVTSFETID